MEDEKFKNIFGIFIKTKVFNFKENIKNIKYYKKLTFLIFDLCFSFIYFFINPYRISKNFLIKKEIQNIHVYGETPLSTIEKITNHLNLKKEDRFLELGSGRGLLAFWIHIFCKCNVTAIEWIDLFTNISIVLQKILFFQNIEFLKVDMFEMDFQEFDYIYLFGSTLEEMEINKLILQFKKLENTKIITISYPLLDYDKDFEILKSFDVTFAFGKTKAYINKKRVGSYGNDV